MLPRAHTGEQPFKFAVRRLSGTSQTGLSVLRQQRQEQAKEEGGDEKAKVMVRVGKESSLELLTDK